MLECQKFAITAALYASSLVGCSTWSEATVADLPRAKIPHDSVVLEAAFLRVPGDTNLDEIWPQIDEQHLSVETRHDLAANGVRTGVVGIQIPQALQTLLDSKTQSQQLTESSLSSNVTSFQQKISNRAGERSELVVVPEIATGTVVLLNDNGRIHAKPFAEGQALFGIRTHPLGDGTVRLDLTPQIKHGAIRQKVVPGQGTYRYDIGREEHSFQMLRLTATLSPGQTLLVTSTGTAKGLGGLFFSDNSASSQRLLLLIRLAQTQYDDLFAPAQTHEPLVTRVE
jgi:hypothetical protein